MGSHTNPYPTDDDKFNRDYQKHLTLMHKKMQIPEHVHPYEVKRLVQTQLERPACCGHRSGAGSLRQRAAPSEG
jgi:hypothetical protein